MLIKNSKILITGGGSGIGFELAKYFCESGNQVIICGRNKAKLLKAKDKLPSLHTFQTDITNANDRLNLQKHIEQKWNSLDILINNAALMNFYNMQDDTILTDEMETNFMAPVALVQLFTEHLKSSSNAAIININSALAYVPMPISPIYSASKAALHSYSISTRHQLKDLKIKVFEFLLPAVDTNMSNGFDMRKLSTSQVVDFIRSALSKNNYEVRIGEAKLLYAMSRLAPKFIQKELEKLTHG